MSDKSTDTKLDMPETVPKTWGGAFKIYKNSKAVILKNWKPYLILVLASALVSGLQDRSLEFSLDNSYASLTGSDMIIGLVCFIATIILSIALIVIVLAGISNKKIELLDSIKQSFSHMVSYFLMSIVCAVILTVSLALLIVPFFFVLPRLTLAQYFLVDKKMGPIESIKASWNATKGHSTKAWGVIGANIAMALLTITIVGIPFALYFLFMYSAAFGVLYAYLARNKPSNQ